MSRHLLNPPVYVAILAITLLAPSSVCSAKPDTGSYTSSGATQQSTVTRTKKTDAESGFSWTDVQNGTLHGVEINEKTIIPCKFTSINYFFGRFSAIIAGSPNQAACYKPDGTVLIDLKYGYEGFSMTEDSPYCSVIKKGCSGLYNLDRKEEIISPSKGYTSIEFWSVIDNQVVVAKGDSKGLFDISKGKEIIPVSIGYTSVGIYSIKDGLIPVDKGEHKGLYDISKGKEIVPTTMGYTSFNLYSIKDGKIPVNKGESEGLYDISKGKEVVPTSMGYTSVGLWSLENERLYVEKGEYKGVYDVSNGREIISPNAGYDSIIVLSEGETSYYSVKKNGKAGICSWEGKEIVSPNRGYDSVYMRKEDGKIFYYISKEEKKGVCIANGKEIISPIYKSVFYYDSRKQFTFQADDGNYYDTGFDLEGNKITPVRPYTPSSSSTSTGAASSTSSSSLSSSSSSSSYSVSSSSGLTSDYGSLLFEGVFTFTGQTIQNLQIVNTGVTFTTSFTIYENVLIPKGDGIARYVGNEDFFTVDCRKYVTVDNPDIFYYVNRVGVVYMGMRTTESFPIVGTITSVGYMILEPGDTRSQHAAVPQSGYNNGYNNGGDKASKEQMYRNQYAQWEKTVISHWNSLTSMRDGAARTSMRMNFRNAQSQMRQVRQNAQMEGISIMASAWETASVPLGYE